MPFFVKLYLQKKNVSFYKNIKNELHVHYY